MNIICCGVFGDGGEENVRLRRERRMCLRNRLIPGVFVILVVIAFNLLGDGMRDAADPYGGNAG